MTGNEEATLRALRVACRVSPDSWVEAWETEPFLPVSVHITADPWYSNAAKGHPRAFAGRYTAWRWKEGMQVTATLSSLRRKHLVESVPLLRATRTGNLLYVGRRVWRPVRQP